jgi:hypothetical protein
MTVFGLFYLGITSVMGVQGATDINVGGSSRAPFTNSSSQSTPVQAGNVTELNISGSAITTHWAGFFGEISGTLTLENSAGDVFYNWSGLNSLSGEVFASASGAVDWGTIDCIDTAGIATLETALSISATDADRIENTYTSNAHPDFEVGGTALSGCNSTNAYVSSALDPSSFYQVLLADGSSNFVYTTLINESLTGFDSATHDFQLLVGESDAVGSTNLYFYIELN